MTLDNTTKSIIKNILGRINCTMESKMVVELVFSKMLKSQVKKLTQEHKDCLTKFIKDEHNRNFILFATVQGGML